MTAFEQALAWVRSRTLDELRGMSRLQRIAVASVLLQASREREMYDTL
jgi:hypothetical protein